MRALTLFIQATLLIVGSTASSDDQLPLRASSGLENRFLVLVTGRVVKGELVPRPGGYDVNLPVGRMFVPSSQIRFTATSMDDAYQTMRDSISELTPDAHLAVARWCLVNKMSDKARREVLDALHLDPYRDDARQMLEDIVRNQKQASIKVTSHRSTGKERDTVHLPDRRSLGGLPPDLAQTFTTRIQPLLSNKCSNSRCHSDGRNSFTVIPTRGKATAYITERNLAAVLKQLDYTDPVRSAVLKPTAGLHGGNRQPLFRGQSGGRQAQSLRRWVSEVVSILGPNESLLPDAKSRLATTPDRSSTEVSNLPPSEIEFQDVNPAGRQRSVVESDRQFLTQAQTATRHDEFNPNDFNRRHHGRASQHAISVTESNATEEQK